MPAGAKPGERRGGRVKGTKNHDKADLRERLTQLNCDPFEGLARIAARVEGENPKLAAWCYAELLSYVESKKKAIEHTGADGGVLRVEICSVLDKRII